MPIVNQSDSFRIADTIHFISCISFASTSALTSEVNSEQGLVVSEHQVR
jgi:hypothetical protein